ncbi:hypothetical protein [Nitrospira moscoviensis]|uniref:Uncharacterized protein n=1 Tax=Nitrospira moscoviensis TaxID=42253 RepID=A0A0K2G970_NITMO|nr:hypothetical protein [Nitrospira moscoviensis]ALA57516.1 conserved membrane protein of unknown function [Nitrospira moscoviensis]
MNEQLSQMVPDPWRSLFHFLTMPLSWIPDMQHTLIGFVLSSAGGWLAGLYYLLLLFPVLLWIGAVWCTHLTLYTLPFRSGRIELLKMILLAWWDTAFAIWMYWVGLARFAMVVAGWLFTLGRLALKLGAEAMKQLVILPFKMTGQIAQSYFQPGVPWIAFLLLIFWCLLEATIFTYTLMPTVTEVLAGITGADASVMTGTILYFFLFLLIMGSFACIQVLADAMKNHEYRYLVQMLLVEIFVMIFEVMFLYRELVDAITPWIAQQTGEQFRLGIGFTLSLATFGWVGVRGMTWFLFGQYGTPPLLSFISRRPMYQTAAAEGTEPLPAPAPVWWRAPLDDFKREVGWLHDKAYELMEYLMLPVLHVAAALLNFAMILVTGKPVFSIPFKSLQEVVEARELLPAVRWETKKVPS